MKKYSKLLSSVMALAMVACMGTTAFAAGPEANPDGSTIESLTGKEDISVELSATLSEETPVYNINVAWTSMEFAYTETASVWDADTHERTEAKGTWSNNGEATITVINHSNVPVDVSNSYTPTTVGQYDNGEAYNGVTLNLGAFGTSKLQAGVEGTPEGTMGTDMTTCTLKVSGTPVENITADTVVGTITVQLATGTYGQD